MASAFLIRGDVLTVNLPAVDAVISDVPYGIGYVVKSRRRQTSLNGSVDRPHTAFGGMIAGDDRPFDPAPWLKLSPKVALFGANHYPGGLPATGRWLIWDKRGDMAPDKHPDAEMIWLSWPNDRQAAARIHRQKWRGIVREGEENLRNMRKLHPNQKPIALLDRIIDLLELKPGGLILDPFMGSGSTGIAAVRRGFDFVGFEVDPQHFETAAARFQREGVAVEIQRMADWEAA